MQILFAGLSASLLTLFILAIRTVLLHRLPKKMFVFLWYIVLLRSFLFFKIPNQAYYFPHSKIKYFITQHVTNFNIFFISSVRIIWAMGAFLIFFVILWKHVQSCREYQFAIPTDHAFINQWISEHPLYRNIQVKQLDKITSPFTYRFWQPVILLPTFLDLTNEKELNYILTHEYIHIKNLDLFMKWLFIISLSIHWMNPFIWLSYLFANRDIELACDEMAVEILGRRERVPYACCILKLEGGQMDHTPSASYMGKEPLEERMISLAKYSHKTKSAIAAAILIVILAALLGAWSFLQGNGHLSELNPPGSVICHDKNNQDFVDDSPSYVANSELQGTSGDYEISWVSPQDTI